MISNAISQIPRPGLSSFLTNCCTLLKRIAIYATLSEVRFREIARLLVSEGAAPDWFANLEVVAWSGRTKDLNLISDAALENCLLVDDFEAYIHRGQHEQWVKVACFAHPYVSSDRELENTLRELRQRINRIDLGAADPDELENERERTALSHRAHARLPANDEFNAGVGRLNTCGHGYISCPFPHQAIQRAPCAANLNGILPRGYRQTVAQSAQWNVASRPVLRGVKPLLIKRRGA